MKKSKILLSILSLVLLVGVIVGVMSMSTSAVGGAVNSDTDWIAAPKKTLVQCPGGDCTHENCYAYSFAVIGDTQNLNYKDVNDDSVSYMNTLYQWLVTNKDSKNIQYVMGVGDITQSWERGYAQLYPEWKNAAEAVSLLDGEIPYSLVRGNHDFSDAINGFNGVFGAGDKQVGAYYDKEGNLIDNQYYENLLALSKTNDNEGRPMAGFRLGNTKIVVEDGTEKTVTEYKIEDTYRKVTMGGHKYIIITLDWLTMSKETDCVTDEADLCNTNEEYCLTHYSNKRKKCTDSGEKEKCQIVTGCTKHNSYVNGITFCSTKVCTDECEKHDGFGWLKRVLAENYDYSAIITLHDFMTRDGSIIDDFEDTFPYENVEAASAWHEVSVTGGNGEPKDLWTDVLSQYANVKMVFCGHIDEDNIITTQFRGVKGNTVTCTLIDGQTIDDKNEPVGLVAMYYIRPDGKVANVEYISTVRAEANKNAYLRDVNQFEVTLDYSNGDEDGWTETTYGDIRTDIYNAHTFHILLDDDSDTSTNAVYISSHDSWEEALKGLYSFSENLSIHKNKAQMRQKTYYIVMSKNYTDTYAGEHSGPVTYNISKVVLDLNDNMLTLASTANKNNVFFPCNAVSYTNKIPNGAITNGKVNITGSAYLAGIKTNKYGNSLVGTLEFSDLEVTYNTPDGVSVKPLVSAISGEAGYSAQINFSVDNCKIDLSNVSGDYTLFKFDDNDNHTNVHMTLKGGSIKGNSVANTTLFAHKLPNDRVKFVKDSSGNYTSVTFTDSGSLSGFFYSEEENKYLEFAAPTAKDGAYVYGLAESEAVLTEYGAIPSTYTNASRYPLIIFKDGEFVAAVDKETSNWWRTIFNTTLNTDTLRSGCTILARDNIKTSGDTWNLCYIQDVTIDLGCFTFENEGGYIFNAHGREDKNYETKVTVIGGTFVNMNDKAAVVAFTNEGGTGTANNSGRDNFYFTFEGTTFDISNSGMIYDNDSTKGVCIVDSYSSGGAGGACGSVTFNDCKIVDNGTTDEKKVLFNLKEPGANKNHISVVVNGGTFEANSLENLMAVATFSAELESGKGSLDSCIFGKGSDGKYLTVKLPKDCEAPKAKYALSDGNYMLTKTSDDGEYAYYDFVNVTTEYGDISYDYLNVTKYPFVVFNKNREAIYAFDNWYKFNHQEITASKGGNYKSDCVVLLRKNYETGTDSSDSPSNFCYIDNITIDLGGNIFSAGGKHMFQMVGKADTTRTTTITVKNGTLKSTSRTPFVFNNAGNTGIDKFNVICENVTFDVTGKNGIVVCYTDGAEGTEDTITLNNCIIERGSSTSAVTLFSLTESSGNKVDVDVIINGGQLNTDTLTGLTFAKFSDEREAGAGSPDSVVFGDAGFTVRIKKDTQIPADTFAFLDESYELTKTTSDQSYDYYNIGKINTEPGQGSGSGTPDIEPDHFLVEGYGIVPNANADDAFLVFLKIGENEYEFKSGYSKFATAVAGAKALATGDDDEMVVYMRANYAIATGEKTGVKAVKGTIIIDLANHTLSTNADKHVFDDHFDYTTSGDQTNAKFATNIVFKNGTIRNDRESKKPFVAIGHYGTYKNEDGSNGTLKQFNFSFDNVTFCGTSNVMLKGWDHGKPTEEKPGPFLGIKINVDVTNCTFDFTDSATGTAVFTFAGTYPYSVVDINLSSCTVKASNLSNYNIYTKGDEDTVTIDRSKDFTLIQTTSTAPTFTYEENGVTYKFVHTKTENGNYICELGTDGTEEGFGTVPAFYKDAQIYPLLVKYADGTVVGYTDFNLAQDAMISKNKDSEGNYTNQTYEYFVRRNMTNNGKKNMVNFSGTVILNLNNKTVEVTKNGNYLFDFSVTDDSAPGVTITVKNGMLQKSGGNGLFCMNYNDNFKEKNASFNWTFDNVTFVADGGSNKNVIFTTWEAGYSIEGVIAQVNVNSTFNDCTFDMTGKLSGAVMIPMTYNDRDRVVHNVTVKGGTIIADELVDINTNFAVFDDNTNGRADSIKFAANDKGESIKLVLPESVDASAITSKWLTSDGTECVFVKTSSKDGDNVYELFVETKYGNIPLNYSVIANYPIVIFKADKTFVGGYSTTVAVIKAAGLVSGGNDGSEVGGADCVIFFRADCSISNSENVTGYKNDVIIDLGGHTLTSTTACFMTLTNSKTESDDKTYGTITFKNGHICYTAGGTASSVVRANGAEGIYTINFENVKISTTNTSSTSKLYLVISTSGSSTANQTINSKFTNCVFDYTKAQKICYFFGSGGGANIVATLDNCEVLAGDNNALAYIDTGNNKQALAYYKGTGDTLTIENNIKFTLNKSAVAPSESNVWATVDGVECVFVKASENAEYANYTLYPKVMVGYKIKTSVTLYSNFVYNIYIPKANVARFNVNGITKANEEIEIDGVLYYLVKVELPAPESLSDIAVCVTLNSGDTTVDANWTLSVLKYAKSVIGGGYDDTTKNLMKDMLAYASAAHTYFENELDDAKVNTITDLLDGYTRDLPTGDAKAPADKTYFTSATVYLGEVPSFRFYLAEGYTADDFSFKVGQRNVTATTGEDKYGNYLEVVMYAYMMLDDVTYTVTDKLTKESVTESYNLYSYYRSADEANKNLIALVEGLMKYSVSAAAYRASVVEN